MSSTCLYLLPRGELLLPQAALHLGSSVLNPPFNQPQVLNLSSNPVTPGPGLPSPSSVNQQYVGVKASHVICRAQCKKQGKSTVKDTTRVPLKFAI